MKYEISIDVDVSKMATGDKIELTRLPKGATNIYPYHENGKFIIKYELDSKEVYPARDGEMVSVEL